jgi:hypothetical protein
LISLREDLISELIFFSAYDKNYFVDKDPRKLEVFKKSFGHFSQAQLNFISSASGSTPPK